MGFGLVISFVMLFILFFEAQSIRFLENGFRYSSSLVDEHQRLLINIETKKMVSGSLLEVHEGSGVHGVDRFEDLCRNGFCLSGRSRKLLRKGTSATSTTTSVADSFKQVDDHLKSKQNESSKKKFIKGNNNEKLLVESKPIVKRPKFVRAAIHSYPDIIDIAGMDYTTARRKSPIHN